MDPILEERLKNIELPPGINRENVDMVRATTCLTGQMPGSPNLHMMIQLLQETKECKEFRILKLVSEEAYRIKDNGEYEVGIKTTWVTRYAFATEDDCVKKIEELEKTDDPAKYIFLPIGTNNYGISFLIVYPTAPDMDTYTISPQIPYFCVINYSYKTTTFEFLQGIAVHDINDQMETAQKEYEEDQKRQREQHEAKIRKILHERLTPYYADPEMLKMRVEVEMLKLQMQRREKETKASSQLAQTSMSRTEMIANGLCSRPVLAHAVMTDVDNNARLGDTQIKAVEGLSQSPAACEPKTVQPIEPAAMQQTPIMAQQPVKRGRGRPKKTNK